MIEESISFNTGMGRSNTKLPFLTNEQMDNLNKIGYTGKLNDVKTSRSEYLNSLKIGKFSIFQTKFDNGDYSESFRIDYVLKTIQEKRREKLERILKDG